MKHPKWRWITHWYKFFSSWVLLFVLSCHYGVCNFCETFSRIFFFSDFKNSKMRACFSTFWATFIFDPPTGKLFPWILKNPKREHVVSANSKQLYFWRPPAHPPHNHRKWKTTRFGLTYVWTQTIFFLDRPPTYLKWPKFSEASVS